MSAPSSRRTFPGARSAIWRRTSGSGRPSTASEAKRQSRATRVLHVGRLELDGEAPLEPVAEALLQARERARRAIARHHDLLAGREQRVEGVDELLLGLRLALEELDVVDQESVEPAVALLEALGPVRAERGHELAGEALGGGVVDGQFGVVPAHVRGDRAHEVRLAQPGRPVKVKGVVGLARRLGHRERGGVGEPVPGPDHEPVELVAGVDRHGLGDAGSGGAGAHPGRRVHQSDALEAGAEAAKRLFERAHISALDPGPDAGRPGQIKGLGLGARGLERVDPKVERGGRKRALELRADSRPGRPGVVISPFHRHVFDHNGA